MINVQIEKSWLSHLSSEFEKGELAELASLVKLNFHQNLKRII